MAGMHGDQLSDLSAACGLAVVQYGVDVGLGAGLPDREGPLVGVAEVLDSAEFDLGVVADFEVAGEVAVGAAPGDGDLFEDGQRWEAWWSTVPSMSSLRRRGGTGMRGLSPCPAGLRHC
jgi:hypothetical protein